MDLITSHAAKLKLAPADSKRVKAARDKSAELFALAAKWQNRGRAAVKAARYEAAENPTEETFSNLARAITEEPSADTIARETKLAITPKVDAAADSVSDVAHALLDELQAAIEQDAKSHALALAASPLAGAGHDDSAAASAVGNAKAYLDRLRETVNQHGALQVLAELGL